MCVRWWRPELLADLLPELRPFGKSAECVEKPVISLTGLCPRGRLAGLRQGRRRGKPEADEQGHGLDRNAHVTFETLKIAVDPIKPLSGGRFLTFISVRTKEAMAASATSERDCSRRSAKSASRRIID